MAYTPSAVSIFSPGNYTPVAVSVFGLDGSITGASCVQVNHSSLAGISQQPAITAAASVQTNTSSTAALSQSQPVSGANATQSNVSGVANLSEAVPVTGANAVQTNTSSAALLAQIYPISPAGCVQVNVSSSMKLLYAKRFFTAAFCARQENAVPLPAKTCFKHEQAVPLAATVAAVRENAVFFPVKTCFSRGQTIPVNVKTCVPVDAAVPLATKLCAPHKQLVPISIKQCSKVENAVPLSTFVQAPHYQLELIYTKSCHPVEDMAESVHVFYRRAWDSAGLEYVPLPVSVFNPAGGYTPAAVSNFNQAPAPVDLLEGIQRAGVRHSISGYWQHAQRLDVRKCSIVQQAKKALSGTSVLTDPPRPPVVDPPGHVTVTIPTRQVYTMLHSLSVTLLNGTPIRMNNISLSLDADSFAYQFSGQLLDKSQLPLLYQTGLIPVQIVITVNGVVFKMIVERIEHTYAFSNRAIRVIGRSLSALLGQPYEQPASATQSSELTVQQLAELLLPGGWTLAWHSTMPIPWLVPSGVYTYTQQTPIQALAQLAQDIGAVLVPARDSQTITIMPRYPKLPWNFGLLSPDLIVPGAAIVNITHRTTYPTQANGVYIHGGEVGGKLGWVRLNGSDGARLAPTVSNALMTDATALRLRGERELAGQYQQPPVQAISMPMDNTTYPLAAIGQHIRINADGQAADGIINSVQLNISLNPPNIDVSQTIQIGEETASAWTAFRELLPRDPLLVAELVSTDGTTALMRLLDNGVVRVRGNGTVNNKYYIRAGKIDGEAPDLMQEEIVL